MRVGLRLGQRQRDELLRLIVLFVACVLALTGMVGSFVVSSRDSPDRVSVASGRSGEIDFNPAGSDVASPSLDPGSPPSTTADVADVGDAGISGPAATSVPGPTSSNPSTRPRSAPPTSAPRPSGPAVTAAPRSAPTTAAPNTGSGGDPGSVCGTWVLQQVNSPTMLHNVTPAVNDALSVPGVAGLSLRVPWNAIDDGSQSNFSLFDSGYQLAHSRGVEYAVRFMAGESTPSALLAPGYTAVESDGTRFPKPFSDTGAAGNPTFEAAFDRTVRGLAQWASAHDVHILHLPWYGQKWNEVYLGPDITNSPGYSLDAWMAGSKRLVDIAMKYAKPGLAIEFPVSGEYQSDNRQAQSDLVDYFLSKAGAANPIVFIQGNGLGKYNSPPTTKPVYRGRQMYDDGSYDWSSVYRELRDESSTYVEVYTGSFSEANAADLQRQIPQFASACRSIRP